MFLDQPSSAPYPPTAPLLSEQSILGLVAAIASQIKPSLNLDSLLNAATERVKTLLDTDRVIIYQLLPDGDGVVSVESVGQGWRPIQGQLIYDPCFQADWVEPYRQGHISQVTNALTSDLRPCYRELLDRMQVQANLVVPITCERELWGLLIAHNCRSPRLWSSLDVELLRQVALQLGLAVGQANLRQRYYQQQQQLSTELAQRTQVLQTFRSRLQMLLSILNGAAAAIVHMRVYDDRSLEIDYGSEGCDRILGFTAQELMDQPTLWQSRILEEDRAQCMAQFFEGVFAEASITLDYRFQHKDGSLRRISDTVIAYRDEAQSCWLVTSIKTAESARLSQV